MNQRKSEKTRTSEQQVRDRRKEADHHKQKEEMLAAAARLFCEKGFDRTTLDEIAARVDLTKPRLYFHFEGKHEILRDCLDRALCQWREVISQIQKREPREATFKAIEARHNKVERLGAGHSSLAASAVR